jgi:all-trans-retinol dehydrogenase (NAD+)
LTDYCASKSAQLGFHEALRVELKAAKKNIPVTIVCPYFINTGMFAGTKRSVVSPMLN